MNAANSPIRTDDQHAFSLTRSESSAALEPMQRATSASVRKVLWAAATRTRNLACMAAACVSGVVLVGLGMNWLGMATIGVGTLAYASLTGRDSVNDRFLCQLFSLAEPSEDEPCALCAENESATLDLCEVDDKLRRAYSAVVSRRQELRELLDASPRSLQARLPEARHLCDDLLANARRLVLRGQRLHLYLKDTSLSDLSNRARKAVTFAETTDDSGADRTYREIASRTQEQVDTHIEISELYCRVLAQLVLIETTLAGSIAKLVKITATDDEESALTAYRVHEELESLMTDLAILETSVDEVTRSQSPQLHAERHL